MTFTIIVNLTLGILSLATSQEAICLNNSFMKSNSGNRNLFVNISELVSSFQSFPASSSMPAWTKNSVSVS